MKGKLLFEEKQTFRGTLLWYILGTTSILSAVGISVYAIYSKGSEGYLATAIVCSSVLVVLLILGASKLSVSIDSSAIYYRYPPFVNSEKTIRKDEIDEAFVRKYRPISEYGGYGFRHSFRSGRALNISGDIGLQLVLKNGKRLLIGTQQPDQIGAALKKLHENWNMNG